MCLRPRLMQNSDNKSPLPKDSLLPLPFPLPIPLPFPLPIPLPKKFSLPLPLPFGSEKSTLANAYFVPPYKNGPTSLNALHPPISNYGYASASNNPN
jgi:hypothetical protein